MGQVPSSDGQEAVELDVNDSLLVSNIRSSIVVSLLHPELWLSPCRGLRAVARGVTDQQAWPVLHPDRQSGHVCVHRITTPWFSLPSSRIAKAGWWCCPSRHMASPAKETGRWR